MSIVVVTGTGTGVGKTVVTAALSALAAARGWSLALVKPAQTGVDPQDPGDLAEIRRLAGLPAAVGLHEFARYPDPLSPAAAARRAGQPPMDRDHAVRRIGELARDHRLVLVEGAGGRGEQSLDGHARVRTRAGWRGFDRTIAPIGALVVRRRTGAPILAGTRQWSSRSSSSRSVCTTRCSSPGSATASWAHRSS